MTEHSTELATVDVCRGCGGLWIEWFDGELSAVARSVSPVRGVGDRNAGPATCPACQEPLYHERYGGDGSDIARCGSCAGAFVPRASYDALVALGPPESEAEVELGVLQQLYRWLRGA